MTPRILVGNGALAWVMICAYQLGANHAPSWGVGLIVSSACVGAALGYALEVPR